MKKNNWKYWILLKIKHGIIGKILFKHFDYIFPLSKEEILFLYPNLEIEYEKEIKKKFGNDVVIEFEYGKEISKSVVYIYFYKNDNIKQLYMSFYTMPNISTSFWNRTTGLMERKYNRKIDNIV